jgi:hypothetical protein
VVGSGFRNIYPKASVPSRLQNLVSGNAINQELGETADRSEGELIPVLSSYSSVPLSTNLRNHALDGVKTNEPPV